MGTAQTTTTVTPVEVTDILYNPGMGFADFHFGWGRTPPLSEYPTTRVAYFRWYWSELEPSPGQFNFAMVDSVIAQARSRNQNLAFRIMPSIPGWLAAQGVGQVGSSGEELPDHNNPLFIAYHERLVKEFGARYAGSTDVDHVDIGSVGCWGEWNSACCPAGMQGTCNAYMPTENNRRATVDWYYKYFPNTPLVALAEGTGYANTRGAGWRGDCFGDYGMFSPTWNHMENYFPYVVQMPEVANVWQKSPVQFEACGVMQDWYNMGFNIDTILQRGLDWHVSVFNGKDSAVPAAWRPKVDEWLKKIGYRFVLTQLTHTNDVAPGGQMQLQASWTNKGVAPAYQPWPLAYRLRNTAGATVAQWRSSADVRTWLPGSRSVQDSVQVPATTPAGTYSLDVAVLSEDGTQAFVQLAIAGKRTDLWYPVSQVRVGGTQPAAPTGTAAFVRIDTTSQGNWRSSYGAEGYNVAGDLASNPSYAAPTVQGSSWTWAASTSDVRALQKASNPADRVAATWYAGTGSSVVIDLRMADSATHQIALYNLDYDSTARRQVVEILDSNNNVLSSQSLSSTYNQGAYLVWNVSGQIKMRVTSTSGANAVVSGLFFGGASAAAPASTATFVKVDTTTKGNWRATYGADGYSVAGDLAANPSYVAPAIQGFFWTWAASTSDVRALQKASNPTDRVAATWYTPTGNAVVIDLRNTDATTHQVALYCLDYDTSGRRQTVEVLDANNNVLNTQSLTTSFNQGVYLVWNVSGHIRLRVTANAGLNAVISGLFFGAASTAPAPTATFVRTDTTTRGSWRGVYGADGYNVAGDLAVNPSYVSPTIQGSFWTWAASTPEIRAPQKASNPNDRVAATWYAGSGSSVVIDLPMTDSATHQVALYCLDYDTTGRRQTVDILDASNKVLSTQSLTTSYSQGAYLVWNVSGRVKMRVTVNSGANAVISGLFFR